MESATFVLPLNIAGFKGTAVKSLSCEPKTFAVVASSSEGLIKVSAGGFAGRESIIMFMMLDVGLH